LAQKDPVFLQCKPSYRDLSITSAEGSGESGYSLAALPVVRALREVRVAALLLATRYQVMPRGCGYMPSQQNSNPHSRLPNEVSVGLRTGKGYQLCHEREHHGRPGATRTRISGLGHRCPHPLDDGPWRRARGSNPASDGVATRPPHQRDARHGASARSRTE